MIGIGTPFGLLKKIGRKIGRDVKKVGRTLGPSNVARGLTRMTSKPSDMNKPGKKSILTGKSPYNVNRDMSPRGYED